MTNINLPNPGSQGPPGGQRPNKKGSPHKPEEHGKSVIEQRLKELIKGGSKFVFTKEAEEFVSSYFETRMSDKEAESIAIAAKNSPRHEAYTQNERGDNVTVTYQPESGAFKVDVRNDPRSEDRGRWY